jgi:pimeloyl-ACP methyl ester carboxylesterase
MRATPAPVWRVEWPRSSFRNPRKDYSTHRLVAELAALVDGQPALAHRGHHWVGEGMGGVVVAELAARYPGLVRSAALVNSPGSQEYTLLGNAVANKFVYFFHHIPFSCTGRTTG